MELWFSINNFLRDSIVAFTFYRRIQHDTIQDNFEFVGYLQIFDRVMAFFFYLGIG